MQMIENKGEFMTNKEIIKNTANKIYNQYKENIQKIKNYNDLLKFESIIKGQIKYYNSHLDRYLNTYEDKNKIFICLIGIKICNLILDKIKILKNNFKNNNLEITEEILTIDYLEDSIDNVINYYIED